MHKDVRYPGVEHAAGYAGLSKDEQREMETEQNAGLQLIPRCRKHRYVGRLELFARDTVLPRTRASLGAKLLEPKDHAPRAVSRDHGNLAKWQFRRIIRATERAGFEAHVLEQLEYDLSCSVLRWAQVTGARDKDRNEHASIYHGP